MAHLARADRIGWLTLISGFVLTLLLLPASVGASFAAFLMATSGLGLVVTGRTGLRAHEYALNVRNRATGGSEPR